MKDSLQTEENRGLKSVKPSPWLEKGGRIKKEGVGLELDDEAGVGFRRAGRSREGPAGAGNSVNRGSEMGRS